MGERTRGEKPSNGVAARIHEAALISRVTTPPKKVGREGRADIVYGAVMNGGSLADGAKAAGVGYNTAYCYEDILRTMLTEKQFAEYKAVLAQSRREGGNKGRVSERSKRYAEIMENIVFMLEQGVTETKKYSEYAGKFGYEPVSSWIRRYKGWMQTGDAAKDQENERENRYVIRARLFCTSCYFVEHKCFISDAAKALGLKEHIIRDDIRFNFDEWINDLNARLSEKLSASDRKAIEKELLAVNSLYEEVKKTMVEVKSKRTREFNTKLASK